MADTKDGGPAFPSMQEHERMNDHTGRYETFVMPAGGMSLRDYFAAKAMQGLVANSDYTTHAYDQIAAYAYRAADEMLKARG